jgi:hypothetical protein
MSLELKVRGKTYKVEVSSSGKFSTYLDAEEGQRGLFSETLKGLEQKLTAATRARAAKVALQFKRLGRKRTTVNTYRGRESYEDESKSWEVIVVTVRGVNEHTHQLMVTWPDGKKGDDESSYGDSRGTYFPMEMNDEEILSYRRQIDSAQAWLGKNSVDAKALAKATVAKALGEPE